MKKSTKAVLLSGLIFPGLGHFALRQYARGSVLVATSLAALWVLVSRAYQEAQIIADQIISGDIPMETGAISAAVSGSSNAADNLVGNIAVAVLVACWLAGIIDSYRCGTALEKQDMRPPASGR